MSTHPITKDTKIQFPCDLIKADGSGVYFINDPAEIMRACKPDWDYVKDGGFTHYSTNPPDQRPKDVEDGELLADLKAQGLPILDCTMVVKSDAQRIAEECAKEVGFEACGWDHAEDTEEAALPVILRHIEPLVRELEEAREQRDRTINGNARLRASMESGAVERDQLRAEVAALRARLAVAEEMAAALEIVADAIDRYGRHELDFDDMEETQIRAALAKWKEA